MKKLITVSLFGTAFAAQAEETAEHMPEFWMPVQEHVVNNVFRSCWATPRIRRSSKPTIRMPSAQAI